MRDKKVQFIVEAAAIAAIYVVLTVVFSAISFGEVQLRFSRGTDDPSPILHRQRFQDFSWDA